MPRRAGRHYTIEDYFAIEESSPIKHEYFDGEVFAMAGASLRHNLITGNVFGTLRTKLEGSSCQAFVSDLRLRTPGGLLTYPDVMAICDKVALSPIDRLDTVLNPALIVEVLSDSTRDYDRGEKFRLYGEIPSLREYLLVEQAKMLVERYSASGQPGDSWRDRWQLKEYTAPDELVEFLSVGVHLLMNEIYAGVNLGPEP
jgi:Uma2 family endonuclease